MVATEPTGRSPTSAAALWRRPALRQLVALVAAGIVCALLQLLWHPGDEAGLLGLGLGLGAGWLAERTHLLIAAAIITPIALVNVLWTAHVLRLDVGVLNLLAVAAGLLLVAWGARAGLVGRAPVSPALLVGLIGVLILGLERGVAPGFYAWFVTLWMPAVVLPLLGLVMLAAEWARQPAA